MGGRTVSTKRTNHLVSVTEKGVFHKSREI